MHEPLRLWTQKNHNATFAEDKGAMAAIAREFEGYVEQMLQVRRAAGALASDDLTTSLMRQQVGTRQLGDDEIVSILRNWTVGEVGTISASVGILVHYISERIDVQQQLRAQPSLLSDAIEEILRIYGPLVANRRITTRPVEIGGRKIGAGERISLIWVSANRDGRVFDDPGDISTESRSGCEFAIWSGNSRLPWRSLGTHGNASSHGGTPRAYDPDFPDSRKASNQRDISREWICIIVVANSIDFIN